MSKREGLVTAAWVTAPAELRALCDAAEGEHEGAESGDGHQHEAACRRCQARSRIAGLGFMPNDTGVARARAYADLQERVEELEKALEEAAQLYHVAQNVVFNRRHKAATSKAWWGCPDGNCPKYAQLLNSGEKAIGSEG